MWLPPEHQRDLEVGRQAHRAGSRELRRPIATLVLMVFLLAGGLLLLSLRACAS